MTTYPKTNPRDVCDAINVANPAIDSQAGPPGAQAKATRAVLDTMVGMANEAVDRQTSGGSGHSKP